MKIIYSFLVLLSFLPTFLKAQIPITGRVTDTKGNPLPGANIYLKGTYDGATADEAGHFLFRTEEKGEQVIVVRYISFASQERTLQLDGDSISLNIQLKESINKLNGVTITAGSFGAGDEKKATSLSPQDILTTASAMGNIAAALQTMPGTQTVAEDGRLFVRGGTGEETQVYIDGLYVQNPYNASLQQVPTRSRFSPFMFKGTLFSTGGYSAEYGQAMSSVLSLHTKDLAMADKTDISLMTIGFDLEHTEAGENQSLAAKIGYTNLTPYMSLVDQHVNWEQAPQSGEASLAYRKKDSHNGLWKVYGNHQFQQLAMTQARLSGEGEMEKIALNSRNSFLQGHYKRPVGEKSVLEAGLSFTNDFQKLSNDQQEIETTQNSLHFKTKIVTDLSERIALNSGVEVLAQTYGNTLSDAGKATQDNESADYLSAAYMEGDIYLSNRLVARLGGRFDYSTTLQKGAISPRFSVAYETGNSSQLSFAYGKFYQKPQNIFLQASSEAELENEYSTHYILNYQYEKSGNYFRVEGYYKDYNNLIRYEQGQQAYSFTNLSNEGYGYAGGLELFWRSKSTIKNADFWVSYTFLDTKRLFKDFPVEATPSFASIHNASVVYKHFIAKLKSQVGGSWSVASGRPYYDPNLDGFNQSRTPVYQNLSLNWAYLYRQNIIFYSAVSNVLGANNIGGYHFASTPDESGFYKSRPLTQGAKRFFFVGAFITITKNKKENQLDRL